MITPFIKEVQHFSIGDGDGIRSTVFFKGCNLCCRWCHNPELMGTKADLKNTSEYEKLIIDEVMSDKAYYDKSGGGVTFSGGEPMLYTDFLLKIMPIFKQNNIHQIIDTAGCVSYTLFEKVLPFTDNFYFDFKCAGVDDYKLNTGGDFDLIYSNLKRLVRAGNVTVRIPVIPNVNDDKDKITKISEYLAAIDIKNVHLLPFHRLGAAKYKQLGIEYDYADVKGMSIDKLEAVSELYRSLGFGVKTEK